MDLDLTRALTFGSMAEAYDRWRPTYPDVAVDWLAPTAPGYVADVGAGTGQLTGALLARGLSVAAVEPDPKMMAVLCPSRGRSPRCSACSSPAVGSAWSTTSSRTAR